MDSVWEGVKLWHNMIFSSKYMSVCEENVELAIDLKCNIYFVWRFLNIIKLRKILFTSILFATLGIQKPLYAAQTIICICMSFTLA